MGFWDIALVVAKFAFAHWAMSLTVSAVVSIVVVALVHWHNRMVFRDRKREELPSWWLRLMLGAIVFLACMVALWAIVILWMLVLMIAIICAIFWLFSERAAYKKARK